MSDLLLDGQRPDEVIKYEYFDTNWYLGDYRDLESDADVEDIKIEFEE